MPLGFGLGPDRLRGLDFGDLIARPLYFYERDGDEEPAPADTATSRRGGGFLIALNGKQDALGEVAIAAGGQVVEVPLPADQPFPVES